MSFEEPKNEVEVIEYVKRRLGYPIVGVELNQEQLSDCVADAKRWFIANWGIVRARIVQLEANKSEVVLPEDVLDIYDVYEERVRFPGIGIDFRDFPFYYQYIFRSDSGVAFSYPAGLYSGLVMQLQWIDQLKRIFSSDLTFEYNPMTRVLRVIPPRLEAKRILVEYLTRVFEIRELFGEALDAFLRYTLACAKERLGRIRSKYSDVPFASGSTTLDGAALLAEALEEQKSLTEWAHNRTKPANIVRG
jgi:hypothetical protein